MQPGRFPFPASAPVIDAERGGEECRNKSSKGPAQPLLKEQQALPRTQLQTTPIGAKDRMVLGYECNFCEGARWCNGTIALWSQQQRAFQEGSYPWPKGQQDSDAENLEVCGVSLKMKGSPCCAKLEMLVLPKLCGKQLDPHQHLVLYSFCGVSSRGGGRWRQYIIEQEFDKLSGCPRLHTRVLVRARLRAWTRPRAIMR